MTRPTQARLRELLHYDPATGRLVWKPRQSGRYRHGGQTAGYVRPDGYRMIQIDRHTIYEHILIWCWMTGEWPVLEVDHIDLSRSNNIWANLRLATPSENAFGRRRKREHRGIELLISGNYRAVIGFRRKKIGLGTHPTLEAAMAARVEAETLYFGAIAFRSP